VAAGANKLEIQTTPGPAIVTIPPGWYYQHGGTSAKYPGLWKAIVDGYHPDLQIRPCTPSKSLGMPGCGMAFRHADKTATVTVDLDITDGIPPELIGWTSPTARTSAWLDSEIGIPGVWRSNSLVDGEGVKLPMLEAEVYASHDGPTARFQRWGMTAYCEWQYREVQAIWVRRTASWQADYAELAQVRLGNEHAAFDHVWQSLGRGQKVIVHPDVQEPPFDLTDGVVVKLKGERAARDFSAIASFVSADAEERYNLRIPTYLIEEADSV